MFGRGSRPMQCGPKPAVALLVHESDNVANRWFIALVSEGVQWMT
jgi:hypothetical protein